MAIGTQRTGRADDRRVFVLLLMFLPVHIFTTAHKCNHQHPGLNEVRHTYIESHHSIRKRNADQDIRIYVWYESSVNALASEKTNLIKNELIPQALDYFSKTLKVKPTGSPIRLSRTCMSFYEYLPGDPHEYCTNSCAAQTMCGHVTVPEEHLQACRVCSYSNNQRDCSARTGEGPGIDGYDFILYVTARQTDQCGWDDTVGFATWCQLETALDRPVAGFANLCPDSLSTEKAHFNNILGSLKHEILHALGFSASLYAFYRDKDGNPLTERLANGKPVRNDTIDMYQWSDRVVRTVKRRNWKVRNGVLDHDVQMLVTERVVEEARNHFGCDELEGLEIENQGGIGSELSHFEKRLLENEAMTGIHSQTRIFSRLSLALMEDTGWYTVNYDYAEPLLWGQGLGCEFAQGSCKHWIDYQKDRNEEVDPYCDILGTVEYRLQCNTDRSSVALCNIHKYSSELPQQYQYFDHLDGASLSELGKYGGSVEMADFCPYHQELEWESESVATRTSHCNNPANAPEPIHSYSLEHYSDSSICIEQVTPFTKQQCNLVATQRQWGSGCYQYSCSSTHGLIVYVSGEQYICYREGQTIDVAKTVDDWLHEGVLACPACQDVCSSHIICPQERDPVADNRTTSPNAIPCVSGSKQLLPFTSLWLTLLFLLFTAMV
ncbi:leishmanolysin-like peptidase [Glandiceps talaboti]